MKPFAAQTYYELLEISVSATPGEIRSAWERLNRMYSDDQVALYGLANASSVGALRKRLREAMEVLTDDELRGMYDEELGLPPRDEPGEEPIAGQLEMGELLRGADHSVASTHPRVTFSWAESAGVQPVASPPPVSARPPEAPVAPAPPSLVGAFSSVVGNPAPSAPPPPAEAERISEESALAMLPRPSPKVAVPTAPDRPRAPDISADAEFNGELLRQVRMSLGMSLAAVADRTRIGAKHLENVEADRYAALPTTVYLRGILMSLAKELRLDGVRVSRSYLSLVERNRSKG